MEDTYVICIARQYGSGGHVIGKILSRMLGLDYYDKELITQAAKKSGICPEYFEHADEKAPGSLSHALSTGLFSGGGIFMYNNSLSNDSIFKYQSEVIRSVSQAGSCIIVGRCADYILREKKNCFSIFITAPLEDRARRIAEREGVGVDKAAEKAKKVDKVRREYYNYYTSKHWGHASSYDLSIDSSILGDEQTACFIRDFVLRALEDMR